MAGRSFLRPSETAVVRDVPDVRAAAVPLVRPLRLPLGPLTAGPRGGEVEAVLAALQTAVTPLHVPDTEAVETAPPLPCLLPTGGVDAA